MGCTDSRQSSSPVFQKEEESAATSSITTSTSGSSSNFLRSSCNMQQQHQLQHSHLHRPQHRQQSSISGYCGNSSSDEDDDITAFASSTTVFQDNLSLDALTDIQPLDHGGFCIVCSCTYNGDQRAVLKIPKPQGPNSAAADLLAEIAIYKRISERGGHPNIAAALGAGFTSRGEPFLVLERLEGGSLAGAIERSRTPGGDAADGGAWVDLVTRLPVALELADALQYLHRDALQGFILHRDLKPTNIGLCAEGHVKVFDFGLSVVQEVRRGNLNQKYQMSGMAGSKRFMSPEVCKGLPYNEKVDVYSFAIVLWEICTLRKPFAGMSVADHYREVITGGLRPPLDPRWPGALQDLLQACWHEDPDRRPSISEARDVLQQIFLAGGGWDI
ncbi:unnamed protein product [Ectocarpus sp. 12 AP-2014]